MMDNNNENPGLEPPVHSTATLLKAVVFATVLAAAVLTVAILPAEYGIDPTGIGHAVGLSKLSGEQQQSPLPQTTPIPSDQTKSKQENTVDIEVPPGKGLEYKFHLVEGAKLHYAWSTKGGPLYFDFHGEPDGDTTGFFESYTITTSDDVRGVLTAPFTGSHGWYWKNKSSTPIVVTLLSEGEYEIIGLK
jgi:hypothetical protein